MNSWTAKVYVKGRAPYVVTAPWGYRDAAQVERVLRHNLKFDADRWGRPAPDIERVVVRPTWLTRVVRLWPW